MRSSVRHDLASALVACTLIVPSDFIHLSIHGSGLYLPDINPDTADKVKGKEMRDGGQVDILGLDPSFSCRRALKGSSNGRDAMPDVNFFSVHAKVWGTCGYLCVCTSMGPRLGY